MTIVQSMIVNAMPKYARPTFRRSCRWRRDLQVWRVYELAGVGIETWLQAGRSRDRIPMGARTVLGSTKPHIK